jgi:hypothetical protein
MGKKRNLSDVITGIITAFYITPIIKEAFHTSLCQLTAPTWICMYSFFLLYVVPAIITIVFIISMLQRFGVIDWVVKKLT